MIWNKNKSLKIIGAVLVVLAVSYGAYLIFRSAPKLPKEGATVQQRVEFMASSGFKRLPEDVQRKYLSENRQRWGGGGERPVLTESQRQNLQENTQDLREKMMKEHLLAYFAKTPEERRAFIKERQEGMEKRRVEIARNRSANQSSSSASPSGSANTERSSRSAWRNRTPEQRAKSRLDNSSPETRALRSAMFKDMRRAR